MSYCTRCHSTEFRFSEYSHNYVCARCGAPMQNESASTDVMIRCQKVRDYIRTEQMPYALNELQSLKQQVPGNVEVQQLYLSALTNQYTQYESGNNLEIEKTIRVLKNMGALPEEAQRYYYEKLKIKEGKLICSYNKTKCYLIIALMAIIFFGYSGYSWLVLLPVFVMFKCRLAQDFLEKRKSLLNFYRNPVAF